MSFEYFQKLCPKGHYWETDVYENETNCPVCNAKYVWSNLVDITNGSFDKDDNGKLIRIDGYIELKEKYTVVCDKCNSIVERVYKIPKR